MKERLIFHVDVNSAFLSWEAVYQLKNGASTDIRTIPAIIGGDTSLRKGVVLAKSLPAKHFGIHTGEPVTDALTKCPSLKSFRPNFPLYREYSTAFITILKKYAPVVEQVSIDESVKGCIEEYGIFIEMCTKGMVRKRWKNVLFPRRCRKRI